MALIELQSVSRLYRSGDQTIAALTSLDLEIEMGEMVAIVGASGSGKSTLMNILGCLDRPSSGRYRVGGRDVAAFSPDDLAMLRREHFGFVFQRYHLLAALDVTGNVEMPAIYAGTNPVARRRRARELLTRLGLGERLDHRPNQLSGGQQQRVAIARALINGGEIILADEPTGALDSASGEAVLQILKELNAGGHTIIIVTHDPAIAAHAPRIIELRDGVVIADTREATAAQPTMFTPSIRLAPSGRLSVWRERFPEAVATALRSMLAHRVRTALTMLGIVIGIAAVVAVVGLGEGSRRKVLSQISMLGASTISIYPGADWGDERASRIRTLTTDDARALAAQTYIDSVTPETSIPGRLQIGNVSVNATVFGIGASYFWVNTIGLRHGRTLSERDVAERRNEVVIDELTAARLIGADSAVGKVILLNKVPFVIIGVTAARNDGSGGKSLQAFIPYTSLAGRLLSPSQSLNGLTVRVADRYDTLTAEKAIINFLTLRHGAKDFFTFNSDRIRKTIESTSRTMAILTSGVAAIALLVGGIGVMNMMLVSVTERTREIGLRVAVGARRLDIILEFLIEAIAICLAGSIAGIGLALVVAFTAGTQGGSLPMAVSPLSIVAACAAAVATGLLFGFLPARNAARLDPVEALARE